MATTACLTTVAAASPAAATLTLTTTTALMTAMAATVSVARGPCQVDCLHIMLWRLF